jgi:hypothetical protein
MDPKGIYRIEYEHQFQSATARADFKEGKVEGQGAQHKFKGTYEEVGDDMIQIVLDVEPTFWSPNQSKGVMIILRGKITEESFVLTGAMVGQPEIVTRAKFSRVPLN